MISNRHFANLLFNRKFAKNYFHPCLISMFKRSLDSTGNEIDLIEYETGIRKAYEIKSGQTFSPDYFQGLIKWSALSKNSANHNFVVYTGSRKYKTSNGIVVPWEMFGNEEDL